MSIDNELRIAVVDDLECDRAQIVQQSTGILERANIPHSVECFSDARAFQDALCRGKKYNLLLLDVMMGQVDGIALAGELRRQGDSTAIIFISSSQEMASRGYRVDAARYLIKPLQQDDLEEALLHCYGKWQARRELLLPSVKGQYRSSFPSIQYVEAYDRGTRFVLKDETVETKLKFSQVEQILPKTMFLVCHRAYIVNLALVKQISPYEFRMKSGALVPISRHRYNEVNQQFVNFVTD